MAKKAAQVKSELPLKRMKPTDQHDLMAYALHDNVTNQYNQPSFYMNDLEARRASEMFLRDPRQRESLPVLKPEHYSLFHVGFYDRYTGKMEGLEAPRHILNMHELQAFLNNQPQS